MIKEKKEKVIEYFKKNLFMCVCDQTLFIWSCDHGRIPLSRHACK